MTLEIYSHSPEETQEIARDFVKKLGKGRVVGLSGELGSGKTCFAKGAISFLTGVDPDQITSPTFTLMEEYGEPPKIFHVDLFRLQKEQEAESLPWDELLGEEAVTFIEWPEKLTNLLTHCHFEVIFSKKGQNRRKIEIRSRRKSDDF